MQTAAVSFVAGNYLSEPAYVQVTDGTLKVGVATTGTSCWVIFKNFHLNYYGEATLAEVVLADYVSAYKEALATAQSYQSQDMFDADKTTLNTAVSANTLNLNDASLTSDQLTEATAALNAAAAAAKISANKYAYYAAVKAAVDGNTNVDITSVEPDQNWGFEQGNLTSWTSNAGGNVATNNNFSGKVGGTFVERWQNNVALGNGELTHDALTLPKGVYTITANAQNIEQYNSNAPGTGYFLCANNDKVEIGAAGSYSVTTMLEEDGGELVVKMALENCTGNWVSCDNFKITYVGEDFPEYTLVDAPMNKDVKNAQTEAENTFKAEKNTANYNALLQAISAAQASADIYAHLTYAVEDANTFVNAAEVDDSVVDDFFDVFNVIKSAYDNGDIADADVMAKLAEIYNALAVVAKSQTKAGADMTYAIINHSFEYGDMTGWTAAASSDTGVRETANTTYATAGSHRFYLFNTWWQGVPLTQTISDLPNGQYTLTASVASDGATIYLTANDEHNEGTETGGDYPTSNQFQEATITFLVKGGTATIGAVGGANGTAGEHKDYIEAGYWWYKADNFRLTFNRALTPEEEAIAPDEISVEDLTLSKGASEALTISYVPENATEGFVTFESKDPSVATVSADGVVTAVNYGETEIIVTSTLETDISAVAKVIVDEPLYSDAANLDFAEGPVTKAGITILTYEKDIKESDNVAWMQPVTGWSFGVENGDAKAAGVVTYGSEIGMGAAGQFYAPATGADEQSNDNVLGLVGVWTGTVQYVQPMKFPAGAYTITVPIYKVGGDNALSKNLIGVIFEDGTEKLATATKYTANTWTYETITFALKEDTYGKLSLGYAADNAGSANQPRLYIDRVDIERVPLATDEEIAALNALIEEAEDYTLGFDADEYAPYANVEGIKVLAQAKSLDTANPIAEVEVLDATEALQSAVWTANDEEVNAVYDGTFATAENDGAPLGWTMSNNTLGGAYHSRAFVGDERLSEFNNTNSGLFLRFDGTNSSRGSQYYYGNTEGYTIPLKANTDYYVKANVAGWGSTGKPIRLNVDGPEGFSSVGEQFNTSVRADNADDAPQEFLIKFTTGNAGNYVLRFQTPGADTNTHNVVVSNIELYRVGAEATLSVTEAKYGTFIAPFDVRIPAGVTAYKVDGAEADGTLSMTEVDTSIPANTPVVVYSESVVSETFFGRDNATEDAYTEGLLTGVYEKSEVPAGAYVLQNQEGKVAFFVVSDKTATVYVEANRAYLSKPEGSSEGVKAFFFGADDDTPTGISAIEALQNGNAVIYNAAGVRIPTLQKGVNIIRTADGKTQKVLVK